MTANYHQSNSAKKVSYKSNSSCIYTSMYSSNMETIALLYFHTLGILNYNLLFQDLIHMFFFPFVQHIADPQGNKK